MLHGSAKFSLLPLLTLFLCAANRPAQSSPAIDSQTTFSSRREPVSAAPFLQKNFQAIRDPEFAARARKIRGDNAQAPGIQHPWKLLSSFPAVIHDLSFRNPQVGYAASEHGLIWKTIDGGKQWNVVLNSDSGDYWFGVQAVNDNDIVVSGFVDSYDPISQITTLKAIARWSHDGGSTWAATLSLAENEWAFRVRFADGVHAVALGESVVSAEIPIYATSAGGLMLTDWNRVVADQDGWFGNQFAMLPDGSVRASGIDYCQSVNPGAAWVCRTSIDPVFDGETFFVDANTGWVAGGSIFPAVEGWVHRTTDGGAIWSGRTLDSPWPIRELLFVDTRNGWAAGGDYGSGVGGIYFSPDGGQTWSLDVDTGAEMDACAKADYMIICAGYDGAFNGHVYGLDIEHIFANGFE